MKFSYFKIFALIPCFVFAGVFTWGAGNVVKPVSSVSAQKSPSPDLVQAKDLIQEAAKKYPHNAELQIQLGFIFKKMKKFGDSQRAFEEAVKIDPHLVEGHYMLGLIYEYKKESKKALAAWQSCLQWATDPEMKNTAMMHIHHLDPSLVIKSQKP